MNQFYCIILHCTSYHSLIYGVEWWGFMHFHIDETFLGKSRGSSMVSVARGQTGFWAFGAPHPLAPGGRLE